MAWRIHNHVLRGEIDNSVKGVVKGRVWLEGQNDPLQLSLTGNACPDLAGCLLTFRNPGEVFPMPSDKELFPIQEGYIGDLTASRKIREFDVPVEEALRMIKQGLKPPEHMSNCLYLEWFSSGNGRVVIEATGFEIEISVPEWQLTAEEEKQRAKQALKGFSGFMDKMDEALDQAKKKADHEKEDWDEFDHELSMRESDALTDKYMELLDKYGDSEESEEHIAREMGWGENEASEGPQETFQSPNKEWITEQDEIEVPDLQPDPATEGIDWIRTPTGDLRHPLQHQCHERSTALSKEIKQLDTEEENGELANLCFRYQMTTVKLAGALNGLAYGRDTFLPAQTVATLKRALGRLQTAQEALSDVEKKNLLPTPITVRVRAEFFEIREGILKLMNEFRGRS